ncbi:MAG TPA: prepilin-type cleavage/methylation domain-containing protein [Gammaproteobacteria bacterium]|uniref:Type IV pilus assembly protein PilW n=3 Tax=Sinimarinibacterium flocculans TaxID=985250 RepID=A0A318EI79_9GAMM|nr:PilW family protein [Sinimarinibacterium flocculans]PXV68424.1 type IV pilus assembly protein PilW [Sinimarinibacterium flocculans]HCO43737.1 prepilin-type cleavage/methylation domain-containing protein [Gammaproteobacteria bacterium]
MTRSARSQRGFGLVELMIALLLGLMVIGGVTSVFLSNKQSYRSNTALSQVQEGSRIAFELLARDIRQAGLTGCGNNRVAVVLNDAEDDWWSDFAVAVRGYEGAPSGTGAPAPANLVAAEDSIVLKGLEDLGVSIESHNAPSAQFPLNATTNNICAGDIVFVCDPVQAAVVQVTGPAVAACGANTTVVHNTGNTQTPGNCTTNLTYNPLDPNGANCGSQCNNGPNAQCYTYGSNSQIAKASAVFWYIGTNPVGGRSLYRQRRDTRNNNFITEEMVRNVSSMQLQYLVDNANYVNATAVPPAAWTAVNPPRITAVRVTLTLEGDERFTGTNATSAGDVDRKIERSYTASVTIRNRVN